MIWRTVFCLALASQFTACSRQSENNPFPGNLGSGLEDIVIGYQEFASIPDIPATDRAPRMMHMLPEPGGTRLFVITQEGQVYSISPDGHQVSLFLNISDSHWNIGNLVLGDDRGTQSFAFHPEYNQPGAAGFGKIYTYQDQESLGIADFTSGGVNRLHDTVLLEWAALDPIAITYDGKPPRELFRAEQPFPYHNGGQIGFNPLAVPGDEDYGLLYLGMADGGSVGDPLGNAQSLAKVLGKILRIDPLGNNSANGTYGIPASNPWANDNDPETLDEIYAIGVRNPQRFNWDPGTGRLIVADIGQSQIEEISPVYSGANLGWNIWEGSYRYLGGSISLENPRGDPGFTWPIVEYDHRDRLFGYRIAVTGVAVFRDHQIPQLQDKIVFGDIPNGELFYVDADKDANGGASRIGRIRLADDGRRRNLLQLINQTNAQQGRDDTNDAAMRFGHGHNGELFLLNKQDGVIRLLVAD